MKYRNNIGELITGGILGFIFVLTLINTYSIKKQINSFKQKIEETQSLLYSRIEETEFNLYKAYLQQTEYETYIRNIE